MIALNESKVDRTIRILAGVLLVSGGFVVGGTAGWVLGIVGVIPLLTGALGWCPLYSLFGINTCPLHKA